MSFHQPKPTFIGLLEAVRVNELIITEKLGDALEIKAANKVPKKPRFRFGDRNAIGLDIELLSKLSPLVD